MPDREHQVALAFQDFDGGAGARVAWVGIVASSLGLVFSVVEELSPRSMKACCGYYARTACCTAALLGVDEGAPLLLVGRFDFVNAAAMPAMRGQHLSVNQQRATCGKMGFRSSSGDGGGVQRINNCKLEFQYA